MGMMIVPAAAYQIIPFAFESPLQPCLDMSPGQFIDVGAAIAYRGLDDLKHFSLASCR